MSKATDTEYEDHTIERIEESVDGWGIGFDGGVMVWAPKGAHGAEPRVGGALRVYGKGFGSRVRGIDFDGREVFYRSAEDDYLEAQIDAWQRDIDRIRAYQREGRAEQDAQYAALPAVFQRRIDGFRARNRDFRWRLEAYELSCCVDAVKIAAWAGTPGRVREYADLDWPAQQAAIPDLFDGHSGNSFAFACRLAHHFLTDPALVEREHGALCVLVGCAEYGCRYGAEAGR